MNKKLFTMITSIILLVTLLPTGGCKLSDELSDIENPESFSWEDIFLFDENISGSMNANGVDQTQITVHILGDTPDGQPITFRTDTGAFASKPIISGNENASQEIIVKSSAQKARVYLISGIEEKRGVISASLEGYTIFRELSYTRVIPEKIVVSTNTTQLTANGNDTAALSVELIAPNTNFGRGTVTVNTRIIFTARDISTGQSLSGLHREALSDNKGYATAAITGRHIGTVKITATVENEKISDDVTIVFVEEED
ncbi:MAG: hypothetical protein KAW12_04375 [Candidatus Aminicenantes bacterium]|nr:hypothetical protein [Candidatus Aminicenantes bacterium]